MNGKRILVAHNNRKYIEEIKQFFQNKDRYILDTIVKTGDELLKLKALDDFDLVIVKDALTEVSGLYALKELIYNTKRLPDNILLITPFLNDFVLSRCKELGIMPIRNMRLSLGDLYKIIYKQTIEKEARNKKVFEPEIEVNNLLNKLGILRSFIGYKYFEYVLNYLLSNDNNDFKYMKNVYDLIAKYYKVSSISVEKAMRTCIKSSFSHNFGYYASILFGDNNINPSISTFIQTCIKILREQRNYIINNQN